MEDSQELVHIQPQTQEVALTGDFGDETGLDAIALKPSNIILVQNTTRNPGTARPGQLLDTLSMEVYDEIVAVPMKVVKQRVLFPAGADLDAEPICRSNDAVRPSPFVQSPRSDTCATCPDSKWIDGQKSPCAEKLKLLFVMKDLGVPYFLNVGGKSITALRTALQLIKRYIAMNAMQIEKTGRGTPLNLYDFFFTVKGEMVNGKFRYAVARFDSIKRVANVGDFGPLFEEFVLRRRLEQDDEAKRATEAPANRAVNDVVEAECVEEV